MIADAEMQQSRFKLKGQHGATLVEYALMLSLILLVFLISSIGLMVASAQRVKESIGTTQTVAPCGKMSSRVKGLLTTDETEATASKAECY